MAKRLSHVRCATKRLRQQYYKSVKIARMKRKWQHRCKNLAAWPIFSQIQQGLGRILINNVKCI